MNGKDLLEGIIGSIILGIVVIIFTLRYRLRDPFDPFAIKAKGVVGGLMLIIAGILILTGGFKQ